VALKFLLKNSPWTWARQWTRAPDGGDLNVNTLFSTVRHGTACGAHFAVSPWRLCRPGIDRSQSGPQQAPRGRV